ncbi:endolytic transglycosylase MltG [Peribacillus alkalitolerans]|uniref:endolytic transglycosylase MltG n=1 Tax=Peribacillus alkalitolerans TaxID=1550385 RepID=UPI0013D65BCB|nr:endolytic transglycosylase MltG [Peribacillus alkalitolerans]
MNKRSIQSFAGGIIFATTIIAGYHYFFEKQPTIQLEEAMKIIEEHGMTIEKTKQHEATKKSIEEKKTPTETESTNKKEEPNEASNTEGNEEKPTADKKEEEKASSLTLTIEPGMNPETIASLLEKQGIIQDKNAFTDYLEKNNLSTKVQLGEYVLTKNMSISQIAKTITN